MPHLVSLISDQPIPNLLFIQSVEQEVEGYIFISTSQMEKKQRTHWLKKAADLPEERCRTIEVEANNYFSIIASLKIHLTDFLNSFIVNITGGNKLMMLACFNFFKELNCTQIYYKSLENNSFYNVIEPTGTSYSCPNIDIISYLTAYGLQFTSSEPTFDISVSNKIFKYYTSIGFNRTLFLNSYWFSSSMLAENYLTGGWFEDFLYYNLRKFLSLNSKNLLFQTKLNSETLPDTPALEFDLIFLKNDRLVIIEAKSSINTISVDAKSPIGQMIYKLGAVKQLFGLKVTAYLVTLSSLNKLNNNQLVSLNEKLNLVGIKLINQTYFKSQDQIKRFITNL